MGELNIGERAIKKPTKPKIMAIIQRENAFAAGHKDHQHVAVRWRRPTIIP
jgi:hypothetical protein